MAGKSIASSSGKVLEKAEKKTAKFLEKPEVKAIIEGVFDPGYMARSLIHTTLPYKDPKTQTYTTRSGKYTLHMTAAAPEIGLPFGAMGRIILMWIVSEAKKNHHDKANPNPRLLNLGRSQAGFMRQLGIKDASGGKKGSATSFRRMLRRVVNTTVTVIMSGDKTTVVEAQSNMVIADQLILWWPKKEQLDGLEDSTILLSEKFFNQIVESAVVLDWNFVKVIKGSPLRLDLYAWLTLRNSNPDSKPVFLAWKTLKEQFGRGYSDTSQGRVDFKRKFLPELDAVWALYTQSGRNPGILEFLTEGIQITPGETHVPKLSGKN